MDRLTPAEIERIRQLSTLGIAFTVIAPDSTGAHHAYSVNLSTGAATGLAELAENTRTRVNNATSISYGPAVLIPPSHVMHVPQRAAATLSAIQFAVDTADVDSFDPKADHAKNASMVAARFATSDGKTVTFSRVADTLLFTKNKVFSLVRRNGQYDRLEPADVLLMRAEFDVVVIDGHAFFFLKPTFERAFGFLTSSGRPALRHSTVSPAGSASAASPSCGPRAQRSRR